MSKDVRRHLLSAALTFLAGFILAVVPVLADPSWGWTGKAAIFALLMTGVRAGLKPLWELSVRWASHFLKRQS